MKNTKRSWHEYFISLLDPISKKSKDQSSKVGAIIVDKKHRILSTGFNGFPIGVNDDISEVPERFQRPDKYLWTEHAERNAIFTAASHGISLEGTSIYIKWYPCPDCARAIIQTGIHNIVIDGKNYYKDKEHWGERWKSNMEVSMTMLNEAGVDVYIYGLNEFSLTQIKEYV